MTKKSRIAICAVFVILGVAIFLVLTGNRGNVSNVHRVVGYSALYDETSINEAFDVIEKKFAKDFEGCTLTELRYDEDVENRFTEEIEKYHKENNQELIVVLSTFDTDEKGGDGGFNPNDTYADWQWHLVKTADKKSWEIINWGSGLCLSFCHKFTACAAPRFCCQTDQRQYFISSQSHPSPFPAVHILPAVLPA